MRHGFPEFVVGGVLLAPFVPQAIVAFAIFLLTRPLRRRVVVGRVFANPPLVDVCFFVITLALVMLVT